ncbi:MAG: hypothetical protein E7649_05670 [Ruminococcaceae bacterium]|nr:hypothetical protein [Oscillospiraceae bacterium]
MEFIKKSSGFALSHGGVSFEFCSDTVPEIKDDTVKLFLEGTVPTPELCDGDRILVPVGEGIALTVGESNIIDTARGDFCSKTGTLCMVIVERAGKFLLISLDNGNNSSYDTKPENGRYKLIIKNKKACGVTYAVFNSLKDACACHRSLHEVKRTLTEKIMENPEIEKLVGGAIFWVWSDNMDEVMYSDYNTDISPAVGEDVLTVAGDLHASGVDRAMMGFLYAEDSRLVEPLYKKYGYISTQYDNYNDVFNPAMIEKVPSNRARNCDYTARRMKDYPEGVQITPSGKLANAWALKGFDGEMYPQNTLCPAVALQRIKEEIPKIIAEYPYYRGRFIDVYGCRLGECHSEVHPLTMDDTAKVKNEAFKSIEDMGLITGTENGFDGIIEHLTYTEGLHSPVILQIPDSGRKHANVFDDEQTEFIGKEMMQPSRRVPLWQLVYHDAMMPFPYWGDSTESSPRYTNRRVLFACLFGCPPIYSFKVSDYEKLKPAILDSYKRITEVHSKVATLKMTDYEVLSDDYMLQRSVFGNKYQITVNFSDMDRENNGKSICAQSMLFEEI